MYHSADHILEINISSFLNKYRQSANMKHLFFLLSQNCGVHEIDLCLLEGVL